MERIGFLSLVAVILLASFSYGEKAESRQFSSEPYYEVESGGSKDHVKFPVDEGILPEDLDAEASVERVQGMKFYAVQHGNMPLIIYPVTNAGLTSPADGIDQHILETKSLPQATQPEASSQSDFDESLKNVAHGFIFPSSPATSHEEIFKQLLEAGSQGPAPEPYVIPTAQANKNVQPDTIIAIPQLTHAYIVEQPQVPVMAIFNPNQQTNEPLLIRQQTATEGGLLGGNLHQSLGMNDIQVNPQYLQNKPGQYHTGGQHQLSSEASGEPQRDREVHLTSPFREEPSRIPLHPPPPIKASTYGPPQTVPTPFPSGQSNRHHPPNHRPAGSPPRSPPQYQNSKGSNLHSKGPPKNRPAHGPYRLHSGPHSHHGHPHHHHQGSPHYRETSHHHQPHLPRPPPNHRPKYEIHETKNVGPQHHSRRPPPHTSSHKHPYNFYHHSIPKPNSGHGGSHPRPGGGSRPTNQHPDAPGKPSHRPTSQKGPRPYGPPKTPPYGQPPTSNSISSSHPAITKAIFHSPHSQDPTANQNAGSNSDHLGYSPGRYEFDNEPTSTTHPSTPSYGTSNHDSHRPPDASPSASISEPYVTSPPRAAYPDEEDDEASPTVEVYNPMNEDFYGADSYQRIKQTFKPPVIVYKGVRPPVRVYQKPETGPPYHHLPTSHLVRGAMSNHLASHSYMPAIESTWANHNTVSTPYYHHQRVRGSYSVASPSASSKTPESPTQNVAEDIHLTTKAPFQYSPSAPSSGSTDSLSSSSDDSSSWTPINAPAGAVPARAYHIPAPDLSRGSENQPINHHSSYYNSVNSRADDEDLVLTEHNSSSNPSLTGSTFTLNSHPSGTGSSQLRRENNSEEVVSAVVLVKHR